ncbi:MAG: TetR/AcrR family transcriptional regulator [Acidobacteriota bacterium]
MYAKSAATIQNILEAARKLFTARSYAEVSMAGIAQQARVTKGALYHHFKSKEELYLMMMHAYLQEQRDRMRRAVESPGSCRQRLRRLTVDFLSQPANKHRTMRLVRRDVNIFRGKARQELIQAYQEALPEQEEAIIRDGIRDGELPGFDARLLAWTQVAMVEVVLSQYARQMLGSPERIADYVLGLFFEGASCLEKLPQPGTMASRN